MNLLGHINNGTILEVKACDTAGRDCSAVQCSAVLSRCNIQLVAAREMFTGDMQMAVNCCVLHWHGLMPALLPG